MDLLKTIMAVGAGSFLGGAGRYLVSLAMKSVCHMYAATDEISFGIYACFP